MALDYFDGARIGRLFIEIEGDAGQLGAVYV